MEGKENGSIFSFIDPIEIPDGPTFAGRDGLWVAHDGFKKLTHYSLRKTTTYSIEELDLVPNRDAIRYVGYFDSNKIFLNTIRNSIVTAFFVHTEPQSSELPIPRVLSFALSSLTFHRRILAAFVPYPGSFCVVSKEGISIHSYTLKVLFFVSLPIIKCCYTDCYVLLTEKHRMTIYKFGPEGYSQQLHKVSITTFGSPLYMIALTHSLVIVYSDGNQNAFIEKIPLAVQNQQKPFSMSTYFGPDVKAQSLIFSTFDDALFVSDKDTGKAILLDIIEQVEVPIGSIFDSPDPIFKMILDKFAYSKNKLYKLKIDYNNIVSDDPSTVAALFRRSNALTRAVALLSSRLSKSQTVEKLQNVVEIVAPSAVSPVAQVRFARAVQFGSIVDPHLILLGLLRYSLILGSRMIDDARVTVIEAVSHAACRNTLRNLVSVWNMKLNAHALRAIIGKFDENFVVDAEAVQDILDYADVCVDFGRREQARRLILRAALDESPNTRKMEAVRKKFEERFGEPAGF